MDKFEREITALYPQLKRYAFALTRDKASGEDLVQDTMVRALRARESYTPDTNLKAWMFTILRNTFLTTVRRQRLRRTLSLDDPQHPIRTQAVNGGQFERLDLKETLEIIDTFPSAMRDSALAIWSEGRSYEEVACVQNIQLGTVKSRVSRARVLLEKRLAVIPDQSGRLVRLKMPDICISPAPCPRPLSPLEFLQARGFDLRISRTVENKLFRLRTFVLS